MAKTSKYLNPGVTHQASSASGGCSNKHHIGHVSPANPLLITPLLPGEAHRFGLRPWLTCASGRVQDSVNLLQVHYHGGTLFLNAGRFSVPLGLRAVRGSRCLTLKFGNIGTRPSGRSRRTSLNNCARESYPRARAGCHKQFCQGNVLTIVFGEQFVLKLEAGFKSREDSVCDE